MPDKAAERKGRLSPISFRVTDELRRKLTRSASLAGHSLTQEILSRLELSLAQDDYLRRMWGEEIFGIAEAMGRARVAIENWTGKPWLEDAEGYELLRLTAAELVRNYWDQMHGTAEPVQRGSFEGKSPQELAEVFAKISAPLRGRPSPALQQADWHGKGAAAENMRKLLADDSSETGEQPRLAKVDRKRRKRT